MISGTEEARLIHLAAAYGTAVRGEIAVAIDIGGGSVEITRGAGPSVDQGRSFKLGVIRLTERFVKSDPIVPARRAQTRPAHRRRAAATISTSSRRLDSIA